MAWILRLTFVVLCWSAVHSVSFSDLDGNTINKLDQYVRQDLAFRIISKLNDSIREQNRLSFLCQSKLNQTITSCQACASSHTCTSQVNVDITLEKLLPFVYRPVLAISYVIDDISKTAGGMVSLLGNLGGSFLKDLGNLAGSVGNCLLQVSLAKFHVVGNGLLSLGTGFENAATSLLHGAGSVLDILGTGTGSLLNSFGQGAGNTLNQLGHEAGSVFNQLAQGAGNVLNQLGQGAGSTIDQLGQGAGHVLNQLGHGAGSTIDQLGQGASSSLTGLVSGVGSLGSGLLNGLGHLTSGATDLINHVFGRGVATVRSVCGSRCPSCDRLNISKYTDHDIIVSVCGNDMVENQAVSMENIAQLEELYNVTVTSSIINKVQFDPTTIQTSDGVSFSSAFVTLSISDKMILASIPSGLHLSDLKSTAHQIVQELWTKAELP